jgi:hypothetical protein
VATDAPTDAAGDYATAESAFVDAVPMPEALLFGGRSGPAASDAAAVAVLVARDWLGDVGPALGDVREGRDSYVEHLAVEAVDFPASGAAVVAVVAVVLDVVDGEYAGARASAWRSRSGSIVTEHVRPGIRGCCRHRTSAPTSRSGVRRSSTPQLRRRPVRLSRPPDTARSRSSSSRSATAGHCASSPERSRPASRARRRTSSGSVTTSAHSSSPDGFRNPA